MSTPSSVASSSDLYAPSELVEDPSYGPDLPGSSSVDQSLHSLLDDRGSISAKSLNSASTDEDQPHGMNGSAADVKSIALSNIYPVSSPHGPRQFNNSKRKREDDLETTYPLTKVSGSHKSFDDLQQVGHQSIAQNLYPGHDAGPEIARNPFESKRARIIDDKPRLGSSVREILPANGSSGSFTLPRELWHRIFCFVPPVFLGRLLRVNRAFNSFLDPGKVGNSSVDKTAYGTSKPLDSEKIWTASRRRFAPGLPKPLRQLSELDMWRLLRGHDCQLCGESKNQSFESIHESPWEHGPGNNFVRIIWPFGVRCCGECLRKFSEKVHKNKRINYNVH